MRVHALKLIKPKSVAPQKITAKASGVKAFKTPALTLPVASVIKRGPNYLHPEARLTRMAHKEMGPGYKHSGGTMGSEG